ncbi:MAG TPA: hypothetical protein VF133_16925, partial [Terriglobales bacterium]
MKLSVKRTTCGIRRKLRAPTNNPMPINYYGITNTMAEILWGAKDQGARLAELTASTEDRAKEHPLRRDIRSLGILLGRVLVEQAGE